MTETTHRTKIDVRVQAREVKELDQDLQKAFDPRKLAGLERAMASLARVIRQQTTQLRLFNAELRQIDQGTERVKKLGVALRGTTAAGAAAGAAATAAAAPGAAGAAPAAPWAAGVPGQAPGGGQQSFRQRHPWYARADTAGRMAAGVATSPLAGMERAAAAIPLGLGAFAAAGMAASFANYGQYMQYERTRMSALPFLGARMPAMGLTEAAGHADRAATAAMWAELGAPLTPAEQAQQAREAQTRASPRLAMATARGRGTAPQGQPGHKATAAQMVHQRVLDAEAQARARAMAQARADYEIRTTGLEAVGQRYGLGPSAALEQAAAAGRAAYGPVGPQGFETLLAARTMTGVDIAQGADIMGHFSRGYGARGPSASDAESFAKTLGDAVAAGMEGTQITQYLSQMSGLLDTAFGQGAVISTQGIGNTMLGLQQMGVAPVQAARLATGFTGAMMQTGQTGPRDAATFALMRAAGYTGRGGAEEYAESLFRLQDPQNQGAVMQNFVSQLRAPGQGPAMQALIMQAGFRGVGVGLGQRDARTLAAGGFTPGVGGQGDLATFLDRGRMAATAFGHLQRGAALEAEQVSVGRDIASTVQNALGAINNIAELFSGSLGPTMQDFTSGVEDATATLRSLASHGQVGGP